MKSNLIIGDLIAFAIILIAGLTFAQLSINAIEREQQGTQQMIHAHKAELYANQNLNEKE